MYFFMLSFCVLWVFGDCISNDSRWHLLSLFPKCWAGPADAAAAQPGVNWWLMEWGYLIRLPKNTYKYILLYPAHMFLTVGMTLGIRVPVVGPLKDINFQKHSGAPLAVLVYIYICILIHINILFTYTHSLSYPLSNTPHHIHLHSLWPSLFRIPKSRFMKTKVTANCILALKVPR